MSQANKTDKSDENQVRLFSARDGVASLICVSAFSLLLLVASPAIANDGTETGLLPIANDTKVTGYLRQYVGVNLSDAPETPQNDKYDFSMLRTTLLMQFTSDLGWGHFVGIGRFSSEQMTNYLDRLRDLTGVTGPRSDFRNKYSEQNELREAYLDLNLSENITARVGKQQVVWGETDFFQAMDVIHGYNQTWRGFLEPENEEWRKPLWLINVNFLFPKANSSLQLIVRPGIDNHDALGNTYDMFGGRWSQNGSRGFNTEGLIPVNYEHSKGDADKLSYGARWSGNLDEVAYTLNYYHTLNQDPVVNIADLSGGFNPLYRSFGEAPKNGFAEFIFPEIDIFGATVNKTFTSINTSFRAELAYTPDKPYNFGMPDTPASGGNGVIKKDTLRSMVGLDKPLRTQTLLGTSGPTSISLQLFDTWILDYKKSEQIVDFGSEKKEHSPLLTALVMMPYRNDSITYSFAVIHDLAYGGMIYVPGVNISIGDHWRVLLEGDFFQGGKYKKSSTDPSGQSLIGAYHYNNQLAVRVSYQF
jgi:hypothetical protein